MDAWSEKQIKAMRVGGNARLRDFFKQHGVTGTGSASIAQKYNTPAAAMYRDIIVALRDGTTPPSDIAPYEEEAAAEAAALATAAASRTASLGSSGGGGPGAGGSGLRMASSSSSGGGGLGRASSTGSGTGSPVISAGGATPGAPADGSETPVQRELRLREEARERLRAKFGEGGLRGQSLSSGGGSGGFGSSSSPAAGGDDGFGLE